MNWFVAAAIIVAVSGGIAFAEDAVDPTAVKSEDGKYLDKEGDPDLQGRGRRHRGLVHLFRLPPLSPECHVCHGPDGMGSTYAPALQNSLKTMSYADFLDVVASGRKNVSTSQENVMPAFGDQPERRLLHGRPLCLPARPRQ